MNGEGKESAERAGTVAAASSVAAPLLEVTGVSKAFPGVQALADVSLRLDRGEVLALVGENGAGKSTLKNILGGSITEYEGRVDVEGATVRFRGPRDAERAGILAIHQELNLVPGLSVAENLFLGRELRTRAGLIDRRRMRSGARRVLDRLGTSVSADAPVAGLSVGEQQLVEIARTLLSEARIVLMDEPTSALTDAEVERLFRIIASMRERGVGVVYVSHRLEEIFRVSDRIMVLRDGRHVATRPRETLSEADLIRLMVGRPLSDFFPDEVDRAASEVLRVRDLWWADPARPGRRRLDGISFSLRAGEVLGLAGLMGAGRTELMMTLFGAVEGAHGGEVRLRGVPLRQDHPGDTIAAGLAYVTEDRKTAGVFPAMSVMHNASISAISRFLRIGIIRPSAERAAVVGMVRNLGVRAASLDARMDTLSGGNQQKVLVGRWLLREPAVLLLDEPTRGIDVGAKAEMYRLIDRLAARGMGIIMASSELPEILAVADRILVLAEGRVTGEFRHAEATEEEIMEAATRRHRG